MRNIFLSLLAAAVFPTAPGATCQVGKLLEFKVTMQDEKPMASIGINGRTLPFVIDSGSFFSAISPGMAQELGLSLKPTGVMVEGVGGSAGFAYAARVKALDLSGVQLHDVEFMVVGSDTALSGLIGQNILGIADVEYDLGHGVVRLMRSEGCSKDDNLAYWAGQGPVSDTEIENPNAAQHHTVGTIRVNGVPVVATFDTGAETSIMSLAAAKRAGITTSSPGVVPSGLGSGMGGRMVQTWTAPINSIQIGTEQASNVKLRIGELPPGTDMLIGSDFFLSHHVYVANALRKMYITYDGGPLFNVTPARVLDQSGATRTIATDNAPAPADAAGFNRRAAIEMARGDYKAALADLDRAVAMAPTNGNYLVRRSDAHLKAHNNEAALADLDRAVLVAPTDAQIRVLRAQSLIERKRNLDALKDLEAANSLLPSTSYDRFALALLFERVDRFDRAIANFDQWIAAHSADTRRYLAVYERCWSRALAGRDLPLALKDLDSMLRLAKIAKLYNGRGLVELRLGDYDRAIADFTKALALEPRTAWSFYGRGLALRHKNNPSAQQDLGAAAAIDPELPARARALGIN